LKKNIYTIVVLFLLFGSSSIYADTYAFTFDDDGFANTAQDSRYTGGLFFTWMSENNDTLYDLPVMENLKTNSAISLTSLIFTPKNKRSKIPIYNDMPYAGYAKLNFLLYKSSSTYFHEFGINVGIVGPSAKAKQLQSEFHHLIGHSKPDGWDTQLRDHPTIGLSYNFAVKSFKKEIKGFKFDWTNNIRADAGNFYSGALVATSFRVGSRFYDTFTTTGNFIGGYESDLLNFDASKNFNWDITFGLFANKVFNYYIVDRARDIGYDIPDIGYITGEEITYSLYYKKVQYSFKLKSVYLHNNKFLSKASKQWGGITVKWKF